MSDPQDRDPEMDEVQPEFRDGAGSGDLGAEETGPPGLGARSGTGGGHEYPGRARADAGAVPGEDDGEDGGPITDSPQPAGEQDQPAPERPPGEGETAPDQPEGERDRA